MAQREILYKTSPESAPFNFQLGFGLLVCVCFPVHCFLTFSGRLVSLVTKSYFVTQF